jgi:hypothetical protein
LSEELSDLYRVCPAARVVGRDQYVVFTLFMMEYESLTATTHPDVLTVCPETFWISMKSGVPIKHSVMTIVDAVPVPPHPLNATVPAKPVTV